MRAIAAAICLLGFVVGSHSTLVSQLFGQGDQRGQKDAVIGALLLAISLLTSPALAHKQWVGGDGVWSDAGHWTPFGLPMPWQNAFLGSHATAANSSVTLAGATTVNALEITDGMRLSTDGHSLTATTETIVTGGQPNGADKSSLYIANGAAIVDFQTGDLRVADRASMVIDDGAIMNASTVQIGGHATLRADGFINLFGPGPPSNFINQGTLWSFGGNLVINDFTGGSIDLDGFIAPGRVHLNDDLTINADRLTDSYSSDLFMGGGTRLQMNLNDPWATDAASEISIEGALHAGPAVIAGVDVQIGGRVQSEVHSRFEADVTFVGTADIEIDEDRTMDTLGEAAIDGGFFLLEEDANLEFDGPTTVAGGHFDTFSNKSSDGAVRFNGATQWRGDARFDGIAMQNGDATVSQPSHVEAEVFDMDGLGSTSWQISASTDVTADSIDSSISNRFDGVINVGGGVFHSLSVNLTGALFDEWVMDGELNLTGSLFGLSRVGGSRMRVTGDVNLSPGKAGIGADTAFDPGSQTTFATPGTQLNMRGETRVRLGATFVGDGVLMNFAGGHMTLDDGVSTDDVGLRNNGLLDIDEASGLVTVDRFENLPDGALAIDVGGHLLGDEFDHLQVAGEASLNGVLAIDLLLDELGDLLFTPQIGDEFMILTALDGVSGEFTDVPPSLAGGQAYSWEALYHPNDVTIRLVDIGVAVPEPAGAVLVASCLTGAILRRR